MAKHIEYQQFKRYLFGFLLAPVAVLFWIGIYELIGWAMNWSSSGTLSPIIFLMLFPIVWFVQAIVGVPVIITLRYFQALNVWTLTAAGAIAGLTLSICSLLFQGYDLLDSFPLSRSLSALMNGASVAWLFWVLAIRSIIEDNQTRDSDAAT